MNKRESLIFTAYTGLMFVKNFSDYHGFVEELLDRPVWTHEFANKEVVAEIKEAVSEEFIQIVNSVK